MKPKRISASMLWSYALFLVGRREFPITVNIHRRFMSKDSANCVHVGYITEERGETRSVGMISVGHDPSGPPNEITFHRQVTAFKRQIGSAQFTEENQVKALIYAMSLVLHRMTEEIEFEAWIIDYPNMNVYSPSGIKKFMASVYIISQYSS